MTRPLLLVICVVSAATAEQYDRSEAMAISQAAIGRHIGNHEFRDTSGQPFALSMLQGKPLVISLVYTSCHHICPLITQNLAETADVAREALGDEAFTIVTIGFDWKVDTPDRMRQYAKLQGISEANWHFLAADAASVESLTEALGFQFFPSSKGFDHLAQTSVIDREGVVYRQVYGVDIDTQSLVEPLKELVFDTPRTAGLVDHWFDTLKLFCTVYDPTSDRYRFDYSILMTIFVGVLSLGAIAVFILREWKRSR